LLDPTYEFSTFEFFSWLGLSAFVNEFLQYDNSERLSVIRVSSIGLARSALHLAIQGGHTTTTTLITDHFDITSLEGPKFQTVIADAAFSGQSDLLEQVQRLRSRQPSELASAVMAAVQGGHNDVLETISSHPAGFLMRDRYGMTALHRLFFDRFQADSDRQLIVATALYFVCKGIPVNAKDIMGNVALHYACFSLCLSHYDVLQALMNEGADPKIKNKFGWTPFHVAARRCRTSKITQTLLQVGGTAMVNYRTNGGSTALHWVTQRGFSDYEANTTAVIRCLLLNGADPLATTRKGVTPLQLAQHSEWMIHAFQSVYEGLDGVHYIPLLPRPIEVIDDGSGDFGEWYDSSRRRIAARDPQESEVEVVVPEGRVSSETSAKEEGEALLLAQPKVRDIWTRLRERVRPSNTSTNACSNKAEERRPKGRKMLFRWWQP
jgi:ankyrin repeat protein